MDRSAVSALRRAIPYLKQVLKHVPLVPGKGSVAGAALASPFLTSLRRNSGPSCGASDGCVGYHGTSGAVSGSCYRLPRARKIIALSDRLGTATNLPRLPWTDLTVTKGMRSGEYGI